MRINIFNGARLALPLAMLLTPLALASTARRAEANPRPLPFTYPYETLPADALEVEQYVDYTPVRVERANADGSTDRAFDGRYVLQTEVEYGITDRLELGTYFVFKQLPSVDEPSMHFEGIKERLRYRFAEAGDLPIDTAVYLELAQFHDEYEIEEKLLLSKRFGHLKVMANAWFEQEFERNHRAAFVFNPTAGLTYQLTHQLFVGFEYWARGRFNHEASEIVTPADQFNTSTQHFLGPAISLQFGRLWWSFGAYERLSHTRHSEVGDEFGKVWFRSVIGLDL